MGLQVCTVGAECGAWTPEPRRQPEMHSSRTRTPRAHDTSSDGNARGLSIQQGEGVGHEPVAPSESCGCSAAPLLPMRGLPV